MSDSKKRMIEGDLVPPEGQPDPKKPNVVKPFFHSGSSSQSDASEPGSIISTDHVEKNPINGGGATFKADGNDKNAKNDEVQADNAAGSGYNSMDPKHLKRLSNRASAQKSRMKKLEHEADLEKRGKLYQNKKELLQKQVAMYANYKQGLVLENHKLKLQVVIYEKERLLKEVEIEKNKAELNKLKESFKKLTIEKQTRMMNMAATLQLMSNSEEQTRKMNMDTTLQLMPNSEKQTRKVNMGATLQLMPNSDFTPSGFRQFICLNSNQVAQNGAETSIPDLNL